MRTANAIVNLHKDRQRRQARALQTGAVLKRVYEGEHIIPLPELERAERNQVWNAIQSGIDAYGQRISSVLPTINFPPLKDSRLAKKRADERREIILAWWYQNRYPLKLRRRARHLVGLATAPVYIRPGTDGIPCWELRDPLNTFPAPCDPDDLVPPDVIFAMRRPLDWLRANYPGPMTSFPISRNMNADMLVDVLQYCDAEEFVLVAVGKQDADSYNRDPQANQVPAIQLQRVPNLAQRPCVVVPGRVTMARLAGKFDQLVGMYEAQGLLWAMHLHAMKRSIFGDVWAVGRPNENVNVIATPDPFQGEIGIIEGGQLTEFRTDPSVQTLQTLDRIERNERITGGVPAEVTGESGSNIRTARRGGQILSAAIDFDVQENQETLAASMEEENRIAIAVARAYWPTTSKTLIVPFSDGAVTYTPVEAFADDRAEAHRVSYAYAGTDTSGLVVEAGQRQGMGTLSAESFMEIDPMVLDVPRERQRIAAEGIERAYFNALQQQAADPQGPYQPQDIARLMELVQVEGKPVYEAEQVLQAEIQARQAQASQGQLSPEQMQPGNAIPGAPGTPQAAAPPAIGEPQPSQQNLAMMLSNLARGARSPAPAQ